MRISQCRQIWEAGIRTLHRFANAGAVATVYLIATDSTLAQNPPDITISSGAPRLFFDDNDSSPYRWELYPDDVSFDITDQTAGTTPFVILPGAPYYSFFMDSAGHIGFGTSDPQVNLHVATPDLFPALRLESSDGASPCAWDLEGSFGGFNLIDVNNSNAMPLRVFAGAPTNSFMIDGTGRAGLGTAAPTSQLHLHTPAVLGSESIAKFEISDDPIGSLQINNVSSSNGIFHPRLLGSTASQAVALTMEGRITADVGGNPVVAFDAARLGGGAVTTRPLVVYRNNTVVKVSISANGNVTATSFTNASSRSLKDNIVDLDSRKAQDALRQLTPVEFVYKDDPTADHRVGFIAEDVPEIIAEADRKSVPIMDVVALVTRVVKDQQQTIDEQGKMIDALMKRLSQLEGQMQEKK